MKILISPHGTHGDIRPLVALAKELREKGYKIIFSGNKADSAFLEKHGFKNYPADFNLKEDLIKHKNVTRVKKKMEVLFRELDQHALTLLEHAKSVDLIIGSGYQFLGSSIAELYNIPYFHTLHSSIVIPNSYTPPLEIKNTNLPRFLNKLLWKISEVFHRRYIIPYINGIRAKHNLKDFKESYEIYRKHMILSINNTLSPLPIDSKEKVEHTDYWHLFEEEELDTQIIDFIEHGIPPIYIGFGSMPDRKGDKLRKAIIFLLEKTNLRFIISSGWGDIGLGYNNSRVLNIGFVPHYKLFPKMALIVHHGGAGTTSTAFYSGVPQVIVPHMADQYYFGRRIKELGLGPEAVRLFNIDRDLPTKIIEAMSNKTYKKNAEQFAIKARENKGVKEAVSIIESVIS